MKVLDQAMIIEHLFIPPEEKNILRKLIGKRILTISSPAETKFTFEMIDSMYNLYIQCEDLNVKIECEDIVAKFYDTVEDGGFFKISEPSQLEKYESIKTINRVVKNISLVIYDVEIEKDNYKITYTQGIIIHFDDCNLLIEIRWLFAGSGFVARLEPLDAENFGLFSEYEFWYDFEEEEGPSKFVQTVEQL